MIYNPIKFTDAPEGDYFPVRISSVTVRKAAVAGLAAPTHLQYVTENGRCFLAKFVAKEWVSPGRIRYEREGQYA